MNLCVHGGQEGPNFSYVVQVVESDLYNLFDVLIKKKKKGRIKSNT